MINSETLIALVHSSPELWDVGNVNYPNKSRRLKAWVSIAEKLGVTEDESDVKIEDDVEDSNSTPSFQEKIILPSSPKKRTKDSSEDQNLISSKRHHWDDRNNDVVPYGNYEDYISRSLTEMDEDYHFLMSILPSVRRVRQDRKTSFKMKVLQLIMDEENAESTERT